MYVLPGGGGIGREGGRCSLLLVAAFGVGSRWLVSRTKWQWRIKSKIAGFAVCSKTILYVLQQPNVRLHSASPPKATEIYADTSLPRQWRQQRQRQQRRPPSAP